MNFRVTSRSQDSNGKHTTALLGNNGDTVVVTSTDYFEGDTCSFQVHPPEIPMPETPTEKKSKVVKEKV